LGDSCGYDVPVFFWDQSRDPIGWNGPVISGVLARLCTKICWSPEKRHSGASRNPVASRQQPGGRLWAPACAGATEEIPLAFATNPTWACLWLRHAAGSFCTSPPEGDIQKVPRHVLTVFTFPYCTQYDCTKSSL
jgi:hypothetical protein